MLVVAALAAACAGSGAGEQTATAGGATPSTAVQPSGSAPPETTLPPRTGTTEEPGTTVAPWPTLPTTTAVPSTTTAAPTTAPSTSAVPASTAPPTTPREGTYVATSADARTSCGAVAHIGDSTSVGLTSPSYIPNPTQRLDAQYNRVGAREQHLEISGARSIVEILSGQVNAYDTAVRLRAQGFHGCWVLALGTTDTANVAVGSSADRRSRIEKMLSVTGADPVLWVNVKTLVPSGAWSNANMASWNQELHDAVSRHPTLHVYDWATVVQDGWFSSDAIHYTGPGYAQRAALIANALTAAFPA